MKSFKDLIDDHVACEAIWKFVIAESQKNLSLYDKKYINAGFLYMVRSDDEYIITVDVQIDGEETGCIGHTVFNRKSKSQFNEEFFPIGNPFKLVKLLQSFGYDIS